MEIKRFHVAVQPLQQFETFKRRESSRRSEDRRRLRH